MHSGLEDPEVSTEHKRSKTDSHCKVDPVDSIYSFNKLVLSESLSAANKCVDSLICFHFNMVTGKVLAEQLAERLELLTMYKNPAHLLMITTFQVSFSSRPLI